MADIDDIIARAQRGGEFGARRNFTLEASRAFKKMRKFALPNPNHYILELLQGAVANGAQYLDLRVQNDLLQLSYVGSGSGFSAFQLENLFEALFSTQAEDNADVRGLAMGFNTLYSLGFDRIVVESGDGTLEGSARLEIQGENVTVGAPSEALRGTFIVVHGGERRPDVEEQLLIDRCISSTIPIAVNGRFLFSTRGEKFPVPFGYRRCLRFDEGDLYGTIGENHLERDASFKIMVHGVHLWSFSFPPPSTEGKTPSAIDQIVRKNLGGIICFNRLNKTVDHADVNRDEIWEELWARLRPYADVVTGVTKKVIPSQIQVIGDPEFTPLKQAADRLAGAQTLILVDPEASEIEKARAGIVADLLEGLPVAVPRRLVSVVTHLVARDVFVIAPSLKDANVMAFFNQDFAATPEEVGEGRALPALNIGDFARTDLSSEYGASLPGTRIQGSLYYVGHQRDSGDGLRMRFVAFGRQVWEGTIESPHRGGYLEVALPSITPSQLEREFGAYDLARRLVAAWGDSIGKYLDDEVSRMGEVGVAPLTAGAHAVLSRIESEFSFGHHLRGNKLSPSFRSWARRGAELQKLPVFKTLGGAHLSLSDLASLMKKTYGLIYGIKVREGSEQFESFVDLEGLNRDRILLMNKVTENTLLTLVGEAGLIRVDQRDVLASAQGIVLRDIAVGLRYYPGGALLAESLDGEELTPNRVRPVQESLLERLIEPVVELLESATQENFLAPDAVTLEWLRQATRHLQWAAFKAEEIKLSAEKTKQLRELPLFLTGDNVFVSYEQILGRHPGRTAVRFLEGVAQDVVQAAADSRNIPLKSELGEEFVLTTNPFVVELMERVRPVSTALVHKRLRPVTLVDEGGAIFVTEVRSGAVRGKIGVAPVGAEASVEVTRPGKPTEWYSGVLRGLPMFGQLHLSDEDSFEEALEEHRDSLLKQLERMVMIPLTKGVSRQKAEAAIAVLLHMTLPRIRWSMDGARAKYHVDDPEADRILSHLMLRLNTGARSSPARVLQTIQNSPKVDVALSLDHSPETFEWVTTLRNRVWDLLVANNMRFEEDRPTVKQEKKPDYASDLKAMFDSMDSAEPSVAEPPEVKPSMPPRPPLKADPLTASAPAEASPVAPTVSATPSAPSKPAQAPPVALPASVAPVQRLSTSQKAMLVDDWLNRSKARHEQEEKDKLSAAWRKAPKEEALRWQTFPEPPWKSGKVVVGVEENGTLHPKFVAWALTHWIDSLCPADRDHSLTSVHFRTIEEGAFGGVIERITPDFPSRVRWSEPPEDTTLRLGAQRYRSDSKGWVVRAYADSLDEERAKLAVVLNLNSELVRTALTSLEDLRRLFPTLLLTVYSAANYRFSSIHAEHEKFFQEAVLEHLLGQKEFFQTTPLSGRPDHVIQ